MTCYNPLTAYRSSSKNAQGKYSVFFKCPEDRYDLEKIQLPCGNCVGCRLSRSKSWAIRCWHETQLHENNCFITLTYNDQHLPADNSLHLKDFQDFMKRLRKFAATKLGKSEGIRFFHCGEYGTRFLRPHYHAILFDFDFPDKRLWSRSSSGHNLYGSEILSSLWPFGFSSIGNVTFDSAAYVARYCLKKVNGNAAEEHYKDVNWHTGELVDKAPEYTTMSRRPGIGHGWISKFTGDVYPQDRVIDSNGWKARPPRYYDSFFEHVNPEDFARIKERREQQARLMAEDNTPERLKVKEYCKLRQISNLVRVLD